MTKTCRKQVKVTKVDDVTALGVITKEELLYDSATYDSSNYDPLSNLDEKEIMLSGNRTDVITIRVKPIESERIQNLANKIGISKSALVRAFVTQGLEQTERKNESEILSFFDTKLQYVVREESGESDIYQLKHDLGVLHKGLCEQITVRARKNQVGFGKEVLHLLSLGLGKANKENALDQDND